MTRGAQRGKHVKKHMNKPLFKKRITKDDRIQKAFKQVDKRLKFVHSGEELKWALQTEADEALSVRSSADLYDLTNIAVGSGESGRVGREIRVTSFQIRYTLQYIPSVGLDTVFLPDQVRIIIYRDKQCNQTAIANGDIALMLDDVTDGTQSINSPFLLTGMARFKIYYDKVVSLAPQSGGYGTTPITSGSISVYKKFKKRIQFKIQYDPADISNVPRTNALRMIVFKQRNAGNPVQLDFQFKVIYKDD